MKQSTIELAIAIVFALFGLIAFGWGVAQLVGLIPYFNHWSDIAGIVLGINCLACSWFINVGRKAITKNLVTY